MALLGVYPRSGIVKAMEPCRAVEIKADQLFSVYQADPEQYVLIFMNMARDLSRRLRDTDDQLVECLEERLQSGLKTIP
jgi:CRP-like cAMP-binding protein